MKLFEGFTRKLVIVFVILSLYLLFFSTGIFDMVTGYNLKVAHCEDTDKGSIYVKGTISGQTDINAAIEPKTDYCSLEDKEILKEFQCDLLTPNNWRSFPINCTNYGMRCVDGACIN
ncbi:MAG: hypothetical protein WC413_04545 [Candidatus Nanoarchaeia archaeon]